MSLHRICCCDNTPATIPHGGTCDLCDCSPSHVSVTFNGIDNCSPSDATACHAVGSNTGVVMKLAANMFNGQVILEKVSGTPSVSGNVYNYKRTYYALYGDEAATAFDNGCIAIKQYAETGCGPGPNPKNPKDESWKDERCATSVCRRYWRKWTTYLRLDSDCKTILFIQSNLGTTDEEYEGDGRTGFYGRGVNWCNSRLGYEYVVSPYYRTRRLTDNSSWGGK